MLSGYFAIGQSDTVKTAERKFLPTGIRFGTDAIALIKSNIQDDFTGWEVSADVDFDRYYLAVEYGHWGRDFVTENGETYSNSGRYWRVGPDVNFLTKDPERNMFFIGLRYGRSVFSEEMLLSVESPVWGYYAETVSQSGIRAGWLELTSGIKVKIWEWIWLGYTARFKFGLHTSGENVMLSHDVPGYGRTNEETSWGFNYHLFFRIPFRKQDPILPGK